MKRVLLSICALSLLFGCKEVNPMYQWYKTTSGELQSPQALLDEGQGLVLIFLSPECPLCANYAPKLQEMEASFADERIFFLGVLSGQHYSHRDMEGFKLKYRWPIEVIADPEFKLAEYYQAKVTPEVCFIDSSGVLRYQGGIDNWAISLGKKRLAPNQLYLKTGLTEYLTGKEIAIQKTEPVGCLIE